MLPSREMSPVCSPHYMPGACRRTMGRGFTMVELLVCMAIVAVLAAIVLPVVARARESARKTMCLSNLRQISVAFESYVADYDECFPNNGDPYLWMGRRWRWVLQPYMGLTMQHSSIDPSNPNISERYTPAILVCPSDSTAPAAWDSTSYGYSAAFYHLPSDIQQMTTADLYSGNRFPCVTQKLAHVAHPAHKALVAEWLTNHTPPTVGWWDWRGARNYLFVDGHARFVSARSVLPAMNGFPDINLTRGGVEGQDLP